MRSCLICIPVMFFLSQCSKVNDKENTATTTKQKTKDTSLLSLSAHLFEEKGDYKSAIDEYNELIDIDSNTGKYFFKRGRCFTELSQYDLSIRDFNKSIYLGYRKGDSYYNKGLIYFILDQDSLAIRSLRQSLKYNPDDNDAKKLLRALNKKSDDYKIL